MSNIEVKRDRGKVTVVITVGDKRASIGLTPERAKRLSAEIMTSALEAGEMDRVGSDVWDVLRNIVGKKP